MVSGRKTMRKKGNQLGSKADVESNGQEGVEYINIGNFAPDEADKLFNSYKENNIRCDVFVAEELKKILRKGGLCLVRLDICVHPECLNRALDLRDEIIPWAKRLKIQKNNI